MTEKEIRSLVRRLVTAVIEQNEPTPQSIQDGIALAEQIAVDLHSIAESLAKMAKHIE